MFITGECILWHVNKDVFFGVNLVLLGFSGWKWLLDLLKIEPKKNCIENK